MRPTNSHQWLAGLPVVLVCLVCQICICNFQMIICCLIYVASFEFTLKSVHSRFTATNHAQTCCCRGTEEQWTRSARLSGFGHFYRRSRGAPKEILLRNKTPRAKSTVCLVNTIFHLPRTHMHKQTHTHTQLFVFLSLGL